MILPALLLLNPYASAEEQETEAPSIQDLAPNTYEKEVIEQQEEYFYEDSLYEKKGNLPEELQDLQYEQRDPYQQQRQLNELFLAFENNNLETNSTAAKLAQSGVFTDTDEKLFQSTGSRGIQPVTEEDTGGSTLTILYITIIGIGILSVLLFLIPKLTAGKEEEL
nr:type VII secretion protein EssA [Metabacillus mangrovi]